MIWREGDTHNGYITAVPNDYVIKATFWDTRFLNSCPILYQDCTIVNCQLGIHQALTVINAIPEEEHMVFQDCVLSACILPRFAYCIRTNVEFMGEVVYYEDAVKRLNAKAPDQHYFKEDSDALNEYREKQLHC